jgi:hypothetical protein
MDHSAKISPEREERDFLHDMAGCVATCLLLSDFLQEILSESKEVTMLQSSLSKMDQLIKSRREILIARGLKNHHE